MTWRLFGAKTSATIMKIDRSVHVRVSQRKVMNPPFTSWRIQCVAAVMWIGLFFMIWFCWKRFTLLQISHRANLCMHKHVFEQTYTLWREQWFMMAPWHKKRFPHYWPFVRHQTVPEKQNAGVPIAFIPNKLLNKQSSCMWLSMILVLRHCNVSMVFIFRCTSRRHQTLSVHHKETQWRHHIARRKRTQVSSHSQSWALVLRLESYVIFHGCWCLDSLGRQVIGTHGIVYVQ